MMISSLMISGKIITGKHISQEYNKFTMKKEKSSARLNEKHTQKGADHLLDLFQLKALLQDRKASYPISLQ